MIRMFQFIPNTDIKPNLTLIVFYNIVELFKIFYTKLIIFIIYKIITNIRALHMKFVFCTGGI